MQTYLSTEKGLQELDRCLERFRQVFLVCGGSFDRLPLGAHFEELAQQGRLRLCRFSGFSPNPRQEDAETGAALFRTSGCTLIAAVGGGSAIDTAKCIRRSAQGHVPLLAVPTTAGSGSEATRFAVIYRQGVKQSVDCGLPEFVLLEPSLLDTLPLYQRKATMLDALCHAVESFWSLRSTPASRALSREAVRRILDHWGGYLQNTPDGNRGMLAAANLAGQAINLTQTTAGHAMCYGLTCRYGLAHGHAAAICVRRLWPYMLENIQKAARPAELAETFLALAESMGCTCAAESAAKFDALVDSLALPVPEVREGDHEALAMTVNAQRLQNNPVPLDGDDIAALYRQIL